MFLSYFRLMKPLSLRTFKKLQSIDRHVLQTLLFRCSAMVGGAAALFLIPAFLSPSNQGIYYLFLSLANLQVFFELGVSSVFSQFVSHEAAHLDLSSLSFSKDDAVSLLKLAELQHKSSRFFIHASTILFLILVAGGLIFLPSYLHEPWSSWAPQWFVFSALLSLNLYLLSWISYFEGLGDIEGVSRSRKRQTIYGYSLFLPVLFFKGGLWVIILLPLATLITSVIFIRQKASTIALIKTYYQNSIVYFDWWNDIWPLQWRISLSWISGFFLFSMAIPLSFSHLGSVQAGMLGMAMSISTSIQTISLSFVSSYVPRMAMAISLNNRRQSLMLLKYSLLRSLLIAFILSLVLLVSIHSLTYFHGPFYQRLAAPSVYTILVLNSLVNVAIFGMAMYMRACKKEPMVWISCLNAVILSIALWYASFVGLPAIALVTFFVNFVFVFPATLMVFRPFSRA